MLNIFYAYMAPPYNPSQASRAAVLATPVLLIRNAH